MKYKIIAAMAAVSMMVPYSAMATHPYVAPAATPPIVFTGFADVQKGLTIENCEVTLTLSGPNNNESPSVHAFSHTDVANLAATLTLSGGTFDLCSHPDLRILSIGAVNLGTGGAFSLSGVDIYTITGGGCRGTLNANWNGTALTFNGTVPEANPSLTTNAPDGNDCAFIGSLTPSGAVTFSAPGDAGH